MNKRSKFDKVVLDCIQDLNPDAWSYSTLLGGRFRIVIRAGIDSFESGWPSKKKGIKNSLYYFQNMKECVGASFHFDGIEAHIDMYIDDKNILLQYDSREGWFGYYKEDGFSVRKGEKLFYRGKYYKAGEEIPGLICDTGVNYVTYK